VFDPATGSFAMLATATASGHRGDKSTDTVVFVPSTVRGAVRVSGAAMLDAVVNRPDGSRLAYVGAVIPPVASNAAPTYTVSVGAPSAALRAEVAAEAASPPAPITEPAARAMVVAALNADARSPDASVRSTAQLVQGLAGIVLGTADPNG